MVDRFWWRAPALGSVEWASAAMSIAGSFRPGHSEREVLRDYVVGKTVEEVVISRKAQMVMNGAHATGTPRSGTARTDSSTGGILLFDSPIGLRRLTSLWFACDRTDTAEAATRQPGQQPG